MPRSVCGFSDFPLFFGPQTPNVSEPNNHFPRAMVGSLVPGDTHHHQSECFKSVLPFVSMCLALASQWPHSPAGAVGRFLTFLCQGWSDAEIPGKDTRHPPSSSYWWSRGAPDHRGLLHVRRHLPGQRPRLQPARGGRWPRPRVRCRCGIHNPPPITSLLNHTELPTPPLGGGIISVGAG